MIKIYLLSILVSSVTILINMYLNNRFGYDWLPMYATDYKNITYRTALLIIISSPFIAFIILVQLFMELLNCFITPILKIINKSFLSKKIIK